MIPGPIERLIEQLARLQGVGRKTASRLAFFLIDASDDVAGGLARAITEVREAIHPCTSCGFLTDADPCGFCTDPRRSDAIMCVVEGTPEVMAIERTATFSGRYHTLGGVISPLEGVGPDDLRISGLLRRLAAGETTEVIVATRPSVDGEATGHYLANILKSRGLRVSRIASGIPIGASLEYADQVTLARALEGRTQL